MEIKPKNNVVLLKKILLKNANGQKLNVRNKKKTGYKLYLDINQKKNITFSVYSIHYNHITLHFMRQNVPYFQTFRFQTLK